MKFVHSISGVPDTKINVSKNKNDEGYKFEEGWQRSPTTDPLVGFESQGVILILSVSWTAKMLMSMSKDL